MKRKMLLVFFALITVICCALVFSACFGENTTDNGSNTEHGINQGGSTQKPDDEQDNNNEHKHFLTLVAETAATCILDGNTAYYTCNDCDKWFADKDGKTEIINKSSVIIAKCHKLTIVEEKDATCTADGNITYYTCSGCNKLFSDKDGKTEIIDKSSVIIVKCHKLTIVEEKGATCTANGNITYYTCSDCNKLFSDKDGKTEIIDKSSVVIAKGHRLTYVEEKPASCVNGNSAYYICNSCNKWFFDVNGDEEIIDKSSVSIPKTEEHIYKNSICTLCGAHGPTQGLKYTDKGEYYEVSGLGEVTEKDIYIAEKYCGKPVASIGKKAFYYCSTLRSVFIPNSITSIGSMAFIGCSGLTSIVIPESVISISSDVFRSCIKLIKVKNGVEYVDNWVIGCDKSLTHITLKDETKGIADESFKSSSLISINIPENVVSIGKRAFDDCNSLTNIVIPDSVVSIGLWAFRSCGNLKSIVIGKNVNFIDQQAFEDCIALTSITIPANVNFIGDFVFYKCKSLTYINVDTNNKMYSSQNGILYNKEKSKIIHVPAKFVGNMVIPDSVKFISKYAFYNCYLLTSVIIPSGVTAIDDYVFSDCSSLKSIVIPESVESVGKYAFYNCDNIENATIPAIAVSFITKANLNTIVILGNNSIESQAFRDCSKLTSLTIGDGVTSIGDCAFYGCSGLTSIEIPQSVVSIGNEMFAYCNSLINVRVAKANTTYHSNGNCIIETKKKILVAGCKNSILPNDGSVTSIGWGAFYGCKGLKNITLPDGVTVINSSAFEYSDLENISIPDSLTSIGKDVFSSCKLQYTLYKNAKYLGNSSNPYVLLAHAKDMEITYCEINEKTKVIGHGAFLGRSNLVSITIPDDIIYIGESAFDYCSNIEKVTMPAAAISKISNTNLKSVTITSGIIGKDAFNSCYNLEFVVLGKEVTSIGNGAFSYCRKLASLVIPNSVTTIGYYAFSGCISLSSVTFEDANSWYVNMSSTESEEAVIGAWNPTKAAKLLTDTYCFYYWKHK